MLALAFRNLFSNPARSVFTAFSVMLAMMLVTIVLAAQLRAREVVGMMKGRNNMLVMGKAEMMPLSFQKQIDSVPGVKRSMYMIVPNAVSPNKQVKFLVHATTAAYTTISDNWFFVEPEDLKRWEGERTGAMVGRNTARDMKLVVGSTVTLDTDEGPLPIVVSAIASKGYKSTGMLVHYDYYAELFKKHNRADVFWVELLPGSDFKSVGKTVDEMFKNTGTPTVSISSTAFLKMSARAGKVIPSLLTGAGLIILLATLLVTANTIAINIRERIPELATLRAIGFRRSRILRLLITEVMIVCLIGGLAGSVVPFLVFGQGVELGTGQLLIGKVELPPQLVVFVLLLSAGLAIVASAIPAWRASRVDIAVSLREQA